MELMDAIHERRAIREYTNEPVAEGVVGHLIEASVQAPSAVNRQPWLFTVVTDQALLDEISAKSKGHLLSSSDGLSGDHQFRKMLDDPAFQIFYDAPVLIVISDAEGGSWAVEDCSLAAENLMLAAYAAGLGTCWIGFAQSWLNTPEGKTTLHLPNEAVPVAPIIVGHPRVKPASVPRRKPKVQWIH